MRCQVFLYVHQDSGVSVSQEEKNVPKKALENEQEQRRLEIDSSKFDLLKPSPSLTWHVIPNLDMSEHTSTVC